jgi:hypothetical protein
VVSSASSASCIGDVHNGSNVFKLDVKHVGNVNMSREDKCHMTPFAAIHVEIAQQPFVNIGKLRSFCKLFND